jgi:hypothetical protein
MARRVTTSRKALITVVAFAIGLIISCGPS